MKNAALPEFLSEFKDDKYINTGNLIQINFDKIAKAKPEVIYISGRTATVKNIDELKKLQTLKSFMLVPVRKTI